MPLVRPLLTNSLSTGFFPTKARSYLTLSGTRSAATWTMTQRSSSSAWPSIGALLSTILLELAAWERYLQ
jgi:hypothetical protein